MTSPIADPSYRPVPAQVDLPQLEREIIALVGRAGHVRGVAGGHRRTPRAGRSTRVRPTANGTPGTHHVEARVFKDVFPRFQTMQGCTSSARPAGTATGCRSRSPSRRSSGFNGKPDIEAYGIAEFNARCRESVLRNVDLFEEMTDRMGYWVDMSEPYRTMDPSTSRASGGR